MRQCCLLVHFGGVDRDAGDPHVRVHHARYGQRQLAQRLERGQRIAGQAAHVRARRFVAEHQRVGLATVDQRERHARVGGVVEAALALDQIPVAGVVGGRQPLDRPGHEVRHHRVERDAAAGDEDPGLPGGAERRGHPARPHLALHRQRRVHLAHRAVGADREAAQPGAPLAVRDGIALRRHPHVVEPAAMPLGGGRQARLVAEQGVQPRREVEPGGERVAQHIEPGGRDRPAAIRHADDQRPCAGRHGGGEIHVRQSHVCLAAVHPVLADRRVGPPVADPSRDLGGQRIGRISEKQQVWRLDHRAPLAGGARGLQVAKSGGGSSREAVRRLKRQRRKGPSGAASTIRHSATCRSPS